jgi:hypothetical protein
MSQYREKVFDAKVEKMAAVRSSLAIVNDGSHEANTHRFSSTLILYPHDQESTWV